MNKRPPLRRSAPVEQENDGIIEGRNAVTEALRAGVTIDKIFIAKGETDTALGHIASAAREKGIVVVDADRRKLDGMSRTHSHQGVIAQAAVREYASVDDILNAAREKGENPLIVVCDEISDPHNLGAVIRTADAAGAHGVIIPKRRSAGLTAIVGKTSAGAVPRRHRHWQRGGRYGPSRRRELRLHRVHPHVWEDQFPQRFRRRRRPAVRGGAAENGAISSRPR